MASRKRHLATRRRRRRQQIRRVLAQVLLCFGVLVSPIAPEGVHAAVCAVPGDRPTIQQALDDAACTSLELTELSYAESIRVTRSLSLAGTAADTSTIEGGVLVTGGGVVVSISGVAVRNGCESGALEAAAGARVESEDLEVHFLPGGPCPPLVESPLFSDGFESGDVGAWSAANL